MAEPSLINLNAAHRVTGTTMKERKASEADTLLIKGIRNRGGGSGVPTKYAARCASCWRTVDSAGHPHKLQWLFPASPVA
jgi:hypothetical protein